MQLPDSRKLPQSCRLTGNGRFTTFEAGFEPVHFAIVQVGIVLCGASTRDNLATRGRAVAPRRAARGSECAYALQFEQGGACLLAWFERIEAAAGLRFGGNDGHGQQVWMEPAEARTVKQFTPADPTRLRPRAGLVQIEGTNPLGPLFLRAPLSERIHVLSDDALAPVLAGS